eukprot:TRINITY_DN14395_c0_g1_i4.p1 TRINITY_DN14395_c0_g1~~TRINITY_DN14395_c0_g1_i4.p1  ORF type:complete len:237 (+),score=58.15 TRINITY_DN14395_c0_g1_i4:73-783(+)
MCIRDSINAEYGKYFEKQMADEDSEEMVRQQAKHIREVEGFTPDEMCFWDATYESNGEVFDWYQCYEDIGAPGASSNPLKAELDAYIKPNMRVLVLGAGNSEVSGRLYDNGVEDITNVDFSKVCVKQQRLRHAHQEKMTWHHTDARLLDPAVCPADSFDVVLDKGCLDCMASGNDSASNVDKLLAQVQLVLKPGGKFLLVSFANEEARLEKYLDKASHHWSDIKTKRMCRALLRPL